MRKWIGLDKTVVEVFGSCELFNATFRLASEYRLTTVLELGTGYGGSGYGLIMAGAHLTTVDISKKCSVTAIENFKKLGVMAERVITTDDRIPNFVEDKQWDAIFIDTSHTYEHTKLELEYCAQRTNLILMDDFWWGDESDKGVKGAVNDFLKTHSNWISEKPEWSKVGLLKKVVK